MKWTMAALLLAAPAVVQSQELPGYLMDPDPLLRGAPTLYVAPGRVFSVELPDGWEVHTNPADPRTVEFRTIRRGQQGILRVHHMPVPNGALPRQLLLNALDDRLERLPGFRELARRDVKIGGLSASVLTAAYSFQGNIQYPRSIEEIFVVAGTDGFVLHFECFSPVAAAFAYDLNAIYATFVVRPAATSTEATTTPVPTPNAEPEVEPLPDPGF